MFSVGDYALHPLHGAGTVTAVLRRAEDCQNYYALRLLMGDGIIYVPVGEERQVGLRQVCSRRTAERLLEKPPCLEPQNRNWQCRYRENIARLRLGDLCQTAQVVGGLWRKDTRRALADSEKRILEHAEHILFSELILATGMEQCQLRGQLEQGWKIHRR